MPTSSTVAAHAGLRPLGIEIAVTLAGRAFITLPDNTARIFAKPRILKWSRNLAKFDKTQLSV
jgi:hypothetical protein